MNPFEYQFSKNIGKNLTYGKTPEQISEIFFKDMLLTPKEIEGKTILVAGCGNGKLLVGLSRYNCFITGVDLNIQVAKNNCFGLKNVCIYKIDIKKFKGYYDYIYCVGVLHHTPNPKEYFNQLVKNLKPNGKIFILIYEKQRLSLLRKLKPYKWNQNNLLLFCKLFAFITFPIYKLIKHNKKPFRSYINHLFDALCCEYQKSIKKEEIKLWFEENKLIFKQIVKERYLGTFKKNKINGGKDEIKDRRYN